MDVEFVLECPEDVFRMTEKGKASPEYPKIVLPVLCVSLHVQEMYCGNQGKSLSTTVSHMTRALQGQVENLRKRWNKENRMALKNVEEVRCRRTFLWLAGVGRGRSSSKSRRRRSKCLGG